LDAAFEFSSGSKRRTASRDDSGELPQLIIGSLAFPRPHGINSNTSAAFSIRAMARFARINLFLRPAPKSLTIESNTADENRHYWECDLSP
jgi:hypothetical protein